jgi:hypothetical protein
MYITWRVRLANKTHSGRERLRQLIDGDALVFKQTLKRRALLGVGGSFFRLKGWVLAVLGLRSAQKGRTFRVSVQSLNHVLVVVIAGLCLAIAGVIIAARFTNDASLAPASRDKSPEAKSLPALRPLEQYLAAVTSKDIFDPQRIAGVSLPPEVSQGSPDESTGPAFRFVGVDWGESPVALIEDVTSSRTYFVKKGDIVKSLTILEVYGTGVKASINGKVIDIK